MKSKVTGGKEHLRPGDKVSSSGPRAEFHSPASLLDVKRILVPVDFSPTSLRTLRSVVPFARRFGATVFLIHVVERADLAPSLNAAHAAQEALAIRLAKEHLAAVLQAELGSRPRAESHVLVGRPFLEIIAFARLHDIDLIVIGPYGESHLGQAILGSTVDKVIRHAPCPVLALHEREPGFI